VGFDLTELSDVARASAKGGFFLFLGNASSTLILAAGSILIARLLGPENYGLYSVALIAPSFLIALCDLGISPALTRFSAQLRAQKKQHKAMALIKTGVLFKLVLSLLLSVTLLISSEFIAANILRRPETSVLIRLASLYLIGQSIYMAIDSTFIGLDRMEKSGLMMNLQATVKVMSSLLLIVLGFSTSGAILGLGIGFIFASVIGSTLVFTRIKAELTHRDKVGDNIDFIPSLKTMVSYGLPLYISTLMISLLTQYRSLILALFTSNEEIGNYATATNFTVLITLLSYPIARSLFPAFSKLSIMENRDSIEKLFKLSVKYTSLLIMPTSMLIALLSREAIRLLYGPQYQLAPDYLALYILSFLCVGLGMFVLDNLFNSQGDTKATLRMNILNFLLSAILAPILTLYHGVLGLIASILISQSLSISYGLALAHREYSISLDWKPIIRIAFASLASATPTYVVLNTIPIHAPLYRLLLGGTLYVALLLAMTPTVGALEKKDIENLDEAMKGIAVYPIIGPFLDIEMRILNKRNIPQDETPPRIRGLR
jgi:O-antigen/teichoic acid export membrane protein